MKSFRKVAIAAMLAVAPVMAVGTAWANTELVPGSRLVAPYWDVSGDRSTLLLITNVSTKANLVSGTSSADLKGTCNLGSTLGGTNCFVHLEFYDKSCVNVNWPIDLSKTDIDQLDLNTDGDLGGVRSLPNKLGWVDIDVRKGLQGSGHTNTGVQANVLMGTVVLSDSGSDFAVAYPMASSIGSSNSGTPGEDIVTRTDKGYASSWSGSYESFPARVFVPMFFAEGNNHGATFTSTLAIAGPAQAMRDGEAPGQDLKDDVTTSGIDEGILIDAAVDIYDACERGVSDSLENHYIFGTLDELFIQQVTAPYGTTGCGTAYPVADIDRKPGQAGGSATDAFSGGWIDIRNGAVDTELSLPRGLVGVLVQNTASRGDATRLWGDCSYGPTTDTDYTDSGCRPYFSLVDTVNHHDIHPF